MNTLVRDVFARRPLSGTTVVDAHAHTGPYSLFFIPRPAAKHMVDVMDRCGVDRAVLSSHLAIQFDATTGNRATAEAVDAFPSRLAGYLVVNPWHDPERTLSSWAGDSRFVGIKVHPDLHGYPVTGSRYAPVWAYASETGTPVLSHTWYGSPFNDPRQIAAVARRHSRLRVLMGHCGGPEPGIDVAIDLAARHPGIVMETCGSYLTGAHLRRMVEHLGAGRVVFGSDFPFIDLRHSLGRTIFADLPEAERRAILGGTASTLFGW